MSATNDAKIATADPVGFDPQVPALVPRSAVTPMEMLATAIERGMTPEVIDKLMALEERWDRNKARKAFDVAIAAAKASIPVITKNRVGHNSKRYADFAAIARTIDPILGKHGLHYRFRTVQDDKLIRTTCILGHDDGHFEENTLVGPADLTGNKNAIQALGSTLSYLQRYSLVQALGLAASDDDDGKGAGDGTLLSDEQAAQITKLITETGTTLDLFLKWAEAPSVSDIPAAKADEAIKMLAKKAEAKKAAQ